MPVAKQNLEIGSKHQASNQSSGNPLSSIAQIRPTTVLLIEQSPNHNPIPKRHQPGLNPLAGGHRLVELVQRSQVRVPSVMGFGRALGLLRGVRVRVAGIGHYAASQDVVRHDEGAGTQQPVGRTGLRAGKQG